MHQHTRGSSHSVSARQAGVPFWGNVLPKQEMASLILPAVAICAPHAYYAAVWLAPKRFMSFSRKAFSEITDPVDSFAACV